MSNRIFVAALVAVLGLFGCGVMSARAEGAEGPDFESFLKHLEKAEAEQAAAQVYVELTPGDTHGYAERVLRESGYGITLDALGPEGSREFLEGFARDPIFSDPEVVKHFMNPNPGEWFFAPGRPKKELVETAIRNGLSRYAAGAHADLDIVASMYRTDPETGRVFFGPQALPASPAETQVFRAYSRRLTEDLLAGNLERLGAASRWGTDAHGYVVLQSLVDWGHLEKIARSSEGLTPSLKRWIDWAQGRGKLAPEVYRHLLQAFLGLPETARFSLAEYRPMVLAARWRKAPKEKFFAMDRIAKSGVMGDPELLPLVFKQLSAEDRAAFLRTTDLFTDSFKVWLDLRGSKQIPKVMADVPAYLQREAIAYVRSPASRGEAPSRLWKLLHDLDIRDPFERDPRLIGVFADRAEQAVKIPAEVDAVGASLMNEIEEVLPAFRQRVAPVYVENVIWKSLLGERSLDSEARLAYRAYLAEHVRELENPALIRRLRESAARITNGVTLYAELEVLEDVLPSDALALKRLYAHEAALGVSMEEARADPKRVRAVRDYLRAFSRNLDPQASMVMTADMQTMALVVSDWMQIAFSDPVERSRVALDLLRQLRSFPRAAWSGVDNHVFSRLTESVRSVSLDRLPPRHRRAIVDFFTDASLERFGDLSRIRLALLEEADPALRGVFARDYLRRATKLFDPIDRDFQLLEAWPTLIEARLGAPELAAIDFALLKRSPHLASRALRLGVLSSAQIGELIDQAPAIRRLRVRLAASEGKGVRGMNIRQLAIRRQQFEDLNWLLRADLDLLYDLAQTTKDPERMAKIRAAYDAYIEALGGRLPPATRRRLAMRMEDALLGRSGSFSADCLLNSERTISELRRLFPASAY